MLSESEALARILADVPPREPVPTPLLAALHHYSADTLRATVPLPGFDNSTMDGYALHWADSTTSTPLPVVAEQPAGRSRHLSLPTDSAIRIFTGAPIPTGADAVIMQEDVTLHRDPASGLLSISCKEPVAEGENIRRQGADLCQGQIILRPGERLSPMRLGSLASQGLSTVSVHRRPRVAVVTTGDELVSADTPLAEGQIYNSNQVMLLALLAQEGITDATARHLADDLEQTTEGLRQLLAEHDLIILSGGVSVGDHDCVKPALQALGIPPALWRVKVKPGKPLLYAKATHTSEALPCHLFGLPGNPVSSFVTYHLFVKPALYRAMGAPEAALRPHLLPATLSTSVENPGDRPHYIRGTLQDGLFTPTGLQQSHALYGLSQANALLRVAEGETLAAQSAITVQWLG